MKRAEKKDYDVYPGKYIPGYDNILREKKKRKLQLVPQQETVVIHEQPDSYKVELYIPGVTRENIFIHCNAGHLYITTQHYNAWKNKNETPVVHKNDFAGIHVTLPADADAEFACAEYKDGSLHIYIPKSVYHANQKIDHIVVY